MIVFRRVLVSTHISQVIAIAALQGFVYWLDEKTEKTGVERVAISGAGRKPEIQRLRNITDIVAVWTPEARALRNHTCSMNRAKCSHFCVADGRQASINDDICACPMGLMLLEDGQNCGALPVCGPGHFTCSAMDGGIGGGGGGVAGGGGMLGDSNKDCIPASWRCDGTNDCPDNSDEVNCPKCQADQFKCQSGECIDRSLVCDGTTHCSDGYDEANCCKSIQDFQCPINKVCIPLSFMCDGWDHCADGADESAETCQQLNNRRTTANNSSDKETFIIVSVVLMVIIFSIVYVLNTRLNVCKGMFGVSGAGLEPKDDPATAPLSPGGIHKGPRVMQIATSGDTMRMAATSAGGRVSAINSYDRNNITGASSSTTNNSNSFNGYPLNPPPSPATCYQPYRHYRTINQPPPPTPCSTDVCDESDSNYTPKNASHHRTVKSRYQHQNRYTTAAGGGEPFPPPPTPGSSHYHSDIGGGPMMESCPPSPGSRSSTYFSPLPPPPSPVPTPSSRGGSGSGYS